MVNPACIDSLHLFVSTENSAGIRESSTHLLDKVLLATKVANIGIWEYVIEETTFLADDVHLSHFGLTLPAFTGDPGVLWDRIHKADQESLVKAYEEAHNTKGEISIECKITWRDGSDHYLKLNALFQWDENGKPCSLVGSSQDITAQKLAAYSLQESEAKFRTL